MAIVTCIGHQVSSAMCPRNHSEAAADALNCLVTSSTHDTIVGCLTYLLLVYLSLERLLHVWFCTVIFYLIFSKVTFLKFHFYRNSHIAHTSQREYVSVHALVHNARAHTCSSTLTLTFSLACMKVSIKKEVDRRAATSVISGRSVSSDCGTELHIWPMNLYVYNSYHQYSRNI